MPSGHLDAATSSGWHVSILVLVKYALGACVTARPSVPRRPVSILVLVKYALGARSARAEILLAERVSILVLVKYALGALHPAQRG